MKLAIATAASLTLFSTVSFADPIQGTLPAGKPAGIRQAQHADDSTLYIVTGVVVLGLIIGIAASTGGSSTDTAPMVTPH
jgi:hypothetical protein